ncbi:hypothetical protein BDF19DRAFT_413916 [Syncephalis fuscata]|nr:hypothetical protein BDF19DRAFT_413916 [Syncephalis fuscata]
MKPTLLAALLLAFTANGALAQVRARVSSQSPTASAPAAKIRKLDNAFMIQLDDATQQAAFRDSLTKLNINFRVRYSLTATMNAISFDTDSKNLKFIENVSGVKQFGQSTK